MVGAPHHYHVSKAALGQFFELMGYVAFDIGEVAFYAGLAQLFDHISPQIAAVVAVDKGRDRHGEDGQVRGRRHM